MTRSVNADPMSQPVFVTGASGFVGKALVHNLKERGRRVTAVSRHPDATPGFNFNHVRRYEECAQFMTHGSCIVHLAARVHVMNDKASDPLSAFRAANVDVTLDLARRAVDAGVKRFIFLSTVKVNGEQTLPGHRFGADDACAPVDAYATSKWEAEQGLRQIAAETGLEIVIIRPPLVYGPGVRANFAALFDAVARGWPLPFGAVDNRRSLIGLDNLLDVIDVSIEHPAAVNQTFLVSDAHDLSLPELIRRIARAVGRNPRLIPVPPWLLKTGAVFLGQQEKLRRLCGNLQLDISKTRELLAWKPPFSVDECLRKMVAAPPQ